MKLFELSQLPFKERFKFVNDLIDSNSEVAPDVKIVKEIFDDTIEWYKRPHKSSDPDLTSKLKDNTAALPSDLEM